MYITCETMINIFSSCQKHDACLVSDCRVLKGLAELFITACRQQTVRVGRIRGSGRGGEEGRY